MKTAKKNHLFKMSIRAAICFCGCAVIGFAGCDQPTASTKSSLGNGHASRNEEDVIDTSESALDPIDAGTSEPSSIYIQITIKGFQSDQGKCRLAIYAGPKNFNDSDYAIVKESIDIVDGQVSWNQNVSLAETDSVSMGKFGIPLAISVYHDRNENDKLDKNAFGVPTELYGFSRNPKRGFGPPKFSDVVVETSSTLDLEIQIQ
jgi:uncharacterized protein (DUF2141 family)